MIDLEGLSALEQGGATAEKLTFPECLGADVAAERFEVSVLMVGVYGDYLRN